MHRVIKHLMYTVQFLLSELKKSVWCSLYYDIIQVIPKYICTYTMYLKLLLIYKISVLKSAITMFGFLNIRFHTIKKLKLVASILELWNPFRLMWGGWLWNDFRNNILIFSSYRLHTNLVTILKTSNSASHCLDLDLNDQKTRRYF